MADDGSRWLRATGIVVLGAVIVLVVVAVSLWFGREQPTARSLDDALQEFRAGNTDGIEAIGAVVQRPQVGVYVASGSGRASIDFPPSSQSYGATIPVTVRHQGTDCWSTQVDFNTAYSQTWDHCIVDGEVSEHANHTATRWDLGFTTIDERTEFVCDPPGSIIRAGEKRDDVSNYTCTGRNSSIDGSTTSAVEFSMLGAESIDIGGVTVPTFHYREVDHLSGAQRGTTTLDYWYSVESFLLVRMTRANELRTDSPVGTVTYTENGSWQLQSLEPAR